MTPTSRHHRPADRLLVQGAAWTVLGPGGVVRGELCLTGDVIVHARIEGTLFTDGEVRVAGDGSVEGGIRARRVRVAGRCRGRIQAFEEIILEDGAVVHADLEARVLTIDDGARFFGDSRLGDAPASPHVVTYEGRDPGHA